MCGKCYKYRLCWACVKWFGCSKLKPEEPSEEKPDGCFWCDKVDCPDSQKNRKDDCNEDKT